jgi:biotin transport system substrate-specific component
MVQREQLRMTVYASLLAALIAVGSYISVPIGEVPIVLQNLFVMLTGLLLGSRWGLAAVAVYLTAGALGLPVFAGGTGGIGRFAGPTGGYLIAYLPAVYVIGFISEKGKHRMVFDVIGMIFGAALVYALGVPWLKIVSGMTFSKAMLVGMYPFLIADVVKIIAAASIAKALRPVMKLREVSELKDAAESAVLSD